MGGSLKKGRGQTNLEHHKAISLENVRIELASGREQLAEIRARDSKDVDPEIVERLETALNDLEKILSSSGTDEAEAPPII